MHMHACTCVFLNMQRCAAQMQCIKKATSSYPGWIKSPHVVTLGIPKLPGGGVFRSKLWSSQI